MNNNLREELSRMRKLAGIINEQGEGSGDSSSQQAPTQSQSPSIGSAQGNQSQGQIAKPKQPTPAQPDSNKDIENISQSDVDQSLKTAMDSLMSNLPNILSTIAKTTGNKDGQLEIGGQPAQPTSKPQPQQQATQQTQPAPQQAQPANVTQEGTLKFNENKYKEYEELNEAGIIGLVASAPAIMNFGGKLVQKLGVKTNSDVLKKFGTAISHTGEKLHGTYLSAIEKVITPLMKGQKPETIHKAAEAVFMGLVGVLFAGGISHPNFLQAVKGKELAQFSQKAVTGVLSQLGFS
jgi:hypothetical protein